MFRHERIRQIYSVIKSSVANTAKLGYFWPWFDLEKRRKTGAPRFGEISATSYLYGLWSHSAVWEVNAPRFGEFFVGNTDQVCIQFYITYTKDTPQFVTQNISVSPSNMRMFSVPYHAVHKTVGYSKRKARCCTSFRFLLAAISTLNCKTQCYAKSCIPSVKSRTHTFCVLTSLCGGRETEYSWSVVSHYTSAYSDQQGVCFTNLPCNKKKDLSPPAQILLWSCG